MPTTIFIALQCCQCSTMQVKQKKKCSNKWSCVVCNQKQSVLKVFAEAYMAKDVRQYVQTFNMSRQFAQHDSPSQIHPQINHNNKRTDWTQYIDSDDENVQTQQDSGDVFEPMLVTELPKALFKKPKLNNFSAGVDAKGGEKFFRPTFPKRNANKQINSLDNEPGKHGGEMVKGGGSKWSDCTKHTDETLAGKEQMKCKAQTATGASKWRNYITIDDDEDNFAEKALWRRGQTTVKNISKWNYYVTEDDDLQLGSEVFPDHMDQWNPAAFEATWSDQGVEEDIHPDFK